MLLAHGDEGLDQVGENEPESIEEYLHVGETIELSINTVVGFSTPRTMKIKGKVGKIEVIVLIDCGATHNFISYRLVDSMALPLSETSHYGVIKGKGICEGVKVTLPGVTITRTFCL